MQMPPGLPHASGAPGVRDPVTALHHPGALAMCSCRYSPYACVSLMGRGLVAEQARVHAPFPQEGGMRAALYDTAVLQDDDFITLPDSAQAMGDNQAGATATTELLQNAILYLGIEGAGGFIQHQDGGIMHEGTRQV